MDLRKEGQHNVKQRKHALILIFLALLPPLLLAACAKPTVEQPPADATVVRSEYPSGVTVFTGTSLEELDLPTELGVLLSNGEEAMRPVTWDLALLPPVLEQDAVIVGTVGDGVGTQIRVKVIPSPPCISAEEADSAQVIAAMERALQRYQQVSPVTWSREQKVALFVLGDDAFYLWKVGEGAAQWVEGVPASPHFWVSWSYDDSYFWVNTATAPDLGCMIVDVAHAKTVPGPVGPWAPDRNVLLISRENRQLPMFWSQAEYASDLVLYDVASGYMQTLRSGTYECGFYPLLWDEPQRVVYGQRYQLRNSEQPGLVGYVGQLTARPRTPELSAEELTGANSADVLDQKLQLAGLRDVTWSPDRSTVVFLDATDCYIWMVGEPHPRKLAAGGYEQLHHLSWSPGGRHLAVHAGPAPDHNLRVFSFPELQVVLDATVQWLAAWSPASSQLLMASPSGIAPAYRSQFLQTANLVLLDVETGERQILQQADERTSFQPYGWLSEEEVVYAREVENGGLVSSSMQQQVLK